jgi:hypothetical protein
MQRRALQGSAFNRRWRDRKRPRRGWSRRSSPHPARAAGPALVRQTSGRVRFEADQIEEAHDFIPSCLAPATPAC